MSDLYPEARMIEAMKIWQLPDNKKDMFSEICASGEYFAEEKIDGYFYEFERTANFCYLFSRNTSVTTGLLSEKSANVPHIRDALSCLPPDTIIIGEIYVPGGTSKSVTTIMGCLPELAIKRQENKPIHYYLHDIIYYDGVNLINVAADKRYKILRAIWKKHNLASYQFLEIAEAFDTDIEDRLSEILARGGEGIVLRKKNLPYYPGKRPAWSTIKIKQMDTVDLVCMGFCDATKEYTGKELPSWTYWEVYDEDLGWYKCSGPDAVFYEDHLKDPEYFRPVTKGYYYGWKTSMRVGAYDDKGNLVEVGTVSSGLTDADKQGMAEHPEEYLGQVFHFHYMLKDNKEHTFRHCRLIGPRPDKPAKDCVISEIFS